MTRTATLPPQVAEMVAAGALVVLNHSGGKDSQAAANAVRALVPAEQLVVVHAELAGEEWEGTEAHARATTEGLEFFKVAAAKTFVDMVRARGMFPSAQQRQCTSDLKRDPIAKLIRRLSRERGRPLVVNVLGLRAEESTQRARRQALRLDKRLSKAGRTVVEWLPVHDWSTAEVFEAIQAAGQAPHWAYRAGMSRLSCCFCIMASRADLRRAAELNPERYRERVALEREVGHTIRHGASLEEVTGIAAEADRGAEAVARFLAIAEAASIDVPAIAGALELVAEAASLGEVAWLLATFGEAAEERRGELPKALPIHGTPITPRRELEALPGKSFCVSYMDPRDGELCADLVAHDGLLLLDNGAFTAWTQGLELAADHWDGFLDWANGLMARCPQAVAVLPDVIGGDWRANYDLALECLGGLDDGDRAMVVWHLDEPLELLEAYCERFRFIAFGSAGAFAKVGSADWRARIAEALERVDSWHSDNAELHPRPHIHMMRGLGQLGAWRFDSADSSNLARNHHRHRASGPGHVRRFADRIEAGIAAAVATRKEEREEPCNAHATETASAGLPTTTTPARTTRPPSSPVISLFAFWPTSLASTNGESARRSIGPAIPSSGAGAGRPE